MLSHQGPEGPQGRASWKLRAVPIRQLAVTQTMKGVEARKRAEIEGKWTYFEEIAPLLHGALLPFQVEGVRSALEFQGRVLIGDDMGVGKTLQVEHVYPERSKGFILSC